MYHTPPYPMLRKNSVRKTADPIHWKNRMRSQRRQVALGLASTRQPHCETRLQGNLKKQLVSWPFIKMSNSSECFMVSWYFMVSFSLDQLIHFSHLPICRISPLGALTCSKASFRAGAVSCNQLWRAWALSWFRGSGFFFLERGQFLHWLDPPMNSNGRENHDWKTYPNPWWSWCSSL